MGQTLWYGAAICEMTGNRTTVMGGLIVDTSFVRMIFSGSDQIVIIETPMPTSPESGNSTSSEFGFSQLVADFRQGKSFPHSLATRTGATGTSALERNVSSSTSLKSVLPFTRISP